MTQIEKAHAWFKSNGYYTSQGDIHLSIQVWNDSLENSIEIYLDMEEIEYRAELWDSQQDTNQTQLTL